MLRIGGVKQFGSEEAQSEHLELVVELFTHVMDKDFFMEVYQHLLMRRLLNEKCECIDMERQIITWIKVACGQSTVNKCEGMLNDLNKSKADFELF